MEEVKAKKTRDIEIGKCIFALDNPEVSVHLRIITAGETPFTTGVVVKLSSVLTRKLSLVVRKRVIQELRILQNKHTREEQNNVET